MTSTRAAVWTAAVLAGVLATGGCSLVPGGEVRTLAKVDGWSRQGSATPPNTFAVLEVADDAETAQRMWDDAVPANLPARDGDPLDQGRYGDLSGVDFSQQVVALWSAGQSGSCPGWLSAVHRADDGGVVVTEEIDTGGGACSADRNPYRTLVVVDRSDLPEASALSSTRATTGDADFPTQVLLATYPLG